MKLKSLSFVLIAGSMLAAFGYAVQPPIQEPDRHQSPFHQIAADDGVIAINLGGTETHQQVGLIETNRRVMSVYHVHRQTGEISLQSVRNVEWDLQLDEFNGVKPSPRDIREIIGRP